jgi:hypothetical protein
MPSGASGNASSLAAMSTQPGTTDTAVNVGSAPQRTHANPFVREAVADMLDSAQRLAGGPKLRGLAQRLGVL